MVFLMVPVSAGALGLDLLVGGSDEEGPGAVLVGRISRASAKSLVSLGRL
jgi:hypothetical protein